MNRLLPTLGLLGLLSTSACQKPAPDLREWKPQDHSNTTNEAVQAKQSDGKASQAPAGLDEVTIATWSAKCIMCHGRIGKGDGPQAPMYQPRDLSDPAWQASVTDERIAEVIQKGVNKMPGFALPEPTLSNLVKLVRLLNAKPATSGSAAPPSASGAALAHSGAPHSAAPHSMSAAAPHSMAPHPTTPAPVRSTNPHP